MVHLPPLNEGELSLILRYSLESDEEMSDAVLSAFLAAGVNIMDQPTELVDWIEVGVLENLSWDSDRPLYVSTRIWDHRVVMTPEEVRLYKAPEFY